MRWQDFTSGVITVGAWTVTALVVKREVMGGRRTRPPFRFTPPLKWTTGEIFSPLGTTRLPNDRSRSWNFVIFNARFVEASNYGHCVRFWPITGYHSPCV